MSRLKIFKQSQESGYVTGHHDDITQHDWLRTIDALLRYLGKPRLSSRRELAERQLKEVE
jgi:hypothetical protein